MSYLGIIISGPKCSGKTTIVKKLTENTSYFRKVKTITTRKRRRNEDDFEYKFLSEEEFFKLKENKKLILDTNYNNNLYGIEIAEILVDEKIPIFIVEPSTIKILEENIHKMLAKEEKKHLLTFFIDSEDIELKDRFSKRNEKFNFEQLLKDREFKDNTIYSINNRNVEKVVDLIVKLWEFRDISGLLHKDLIMNGLECGMFLDNANISYLRGASYDLHLGEEFYYGGRINKISDDEPFFRIEPYDYAIVTSSESANLPKNVAAKFDLTVSLFCQGIILSNGPQIDPGFRGKLFCLLFNTSNKPVVLKKQQKYATIEFNKLIFHTEKYAGKYQDEHKIINYLPSNVMQGAVSELKKELDELKNETKNLHTYFMAVIAIILATIPLMLIFKG